MKRKILWLGLSCLMVAAMLLASCNKVTPTTTATTSPFKPHSGSMPKVFKFGTLQAMTGFGAYWGQTETQGQYLAIEEINATGEFPFKLELIVGDHKSDDPVAGLNAARKMMDVDKVPWIATSWVATSLAVAPVSAEKGVVVVNGGGCGEAMIGLPWFHNTRLDASQALPPVMDYAYKLGAKKMAIIWWNDATGTGFAKVIREKAKQLGVQIVMDEGYTPGLTDYRSIIAKIKVTDADSIGMWSVGVDVGYFMKQAREMGVNLPVYSFDCPAEATKIAGASIDGLYYGGDIWTIMIDTKWSKDFTANFTKRWGTPAAEIDVFSAYYYELTYVLRDVIRYVLAQGGDPFDGRQLEIAIGKIKKFPTLFSDEKMELLPNGMCIKPTFVIKVDAAGNKTIVFTDPSPKPLFNFPEGQWITK